MVVFFKRPLSQCGFCLIVEVFSDGGISVA